MLVRQTQIDTSTPMVTEQRHAWGRAYRDGEVVCGRVRVAIGHDGRIGLARHERRYVSVRFLEGLHPALQAELAQLVRRRGAAARRVAERMKPITLVLDDADLGQIIGSVEPPHQRRGTLHEIDFAVRELTR